MGKRERRRQRERDAQLRSRWAPPPLLPTTEHLRELAERQRTLSDEVDAEIDRLSAAGVSWPTIAAALGVSRQAARQRAARRRAGADDAHHD